MTLDLVKIIAGVDPCGLEPTVVTGLRKAEMSDRSQLFQCELRLSTSRCMACQLQGQLLLLTPAQNSLHSM